MRQKKKKPGEQERKSCKDNWRKRNLGGASGKDGEGNGTPLQYSCLENPMDGGAW